MADEKKSELNKLQAFSGGLKNAVIQNVTHDGIVEFRDPEIDVQEIMKRIRENMATRKVLGPGLSSAALTEERLLLRAAHESLRVRVNVYGDLGHPRPGLRGKIIFFMRRIILRLIRKQVDQERDVQDGLLKFVGRLIPYLDQQNQNIMECFNRIEKLEEALKQKQPSAHN